MSNATTRVTFTIVDDELVVSAPPALEPLDDFFEIEVGASDAMLDLIEHHVRHSREWRFTGDACHVKLDGETVTIEHSHTGAHMSLTRTDFHDLLADLRALLAES
jgi:hypothetical protein